MSLLDTLSGPHRRLFLILVSVTIDLAIVGLILGIFAGDEILNALGLDSLLVGESSPVTVALLCAGGLLSVIGGGIVVLAGFRSTMPAGAPNDPSAGMMDQEEARMARYRFIAIGIALVVLSMVLLFAAGVSIQQLGGLAEQGTKTKA